MAAKSKAASWLCGGAMVAALLLASACGGGEKEQRATVTPVSATATPTIASSATATPAGTAQAAQGTPEDAAGRVLGVGIYPSTVEFGQTLRGSEYFRTVGVMNPGDVEQSFVLRIDGAATPWLSFVDPQDRTRALNSVSVPPRGEARVFLRLLVQPDVANGSYTGIVQAVSAADSTDANEDAGAGVNVGAEIDVTLEVTGTQSIAGSLTDVATRDVEVGSPLRIRTTVQNSGNVQINPQIHLDVVDPGGSVVGQASFDGEVVYPNEIKVLISEWDTTGQPPGERVARVDVKFGDLDVGSKEAHFNILGVGTLTRQGTLDSISLENAPYAGVMAKIGANFRNTGQIDSRAVFEGEVYYKDALIDTISTRERLLEPGEAAVLEASIAVPNAGLYTVKGKVNYEGKETEVKELLFNVPGPPGAGDEIPLWLWIAIGGGGLVAVIIVVAGSWTLTRRLLRFLRS